MKEKVLIAEDHQSANISVQKTLEELGISRTEYVYYCDDAYQKICIAKEKGEPFDLLITDLYFEEDQNKQHLEGGFALVEAARRVQPDLKILVFSAESRAGIIESLFNKWMVDGYVRKARNDSKELALAIRTISDNNRYYPRHLLQLVKQKNAHQFSEFDVTLISLLAQGHRQKDIPEYLQKNNIRPSGISSVEKRLNYLREALGFTKNEQLVAFCKDMGII